MSDISSVSGETDSQLDNMFPQDEEEEVEGLDRTIHSTANNLGTISQQNQNQQEESDLDFDSDDDDDIDDADSDIFDDDIQDSQQQPQRNDVNRINQQQNRKNDQENSLYDSYSQSQSAIQIRGQSGSKKKPKNFNRYKEINNSQVSQKGLPRSKADKNQIKAQNANQQYSDDQMDQEDDDEVLEDEANSQDNEKENQDDLYDDSFLESSENPDSQRQVREDLNKSSDDLDISFSGLTSNQATTQQQQNINQAMNKRKNSLKPHQISQFGSPRASRKNSEMLQKENSMIQVSKPSDRLKKQYRKYQELAALIPTLRNFEWYETTAFQNKLLPIKFLTAASFWFMVCAEYFPRKIVYQKEDDLIRDLQSRLDRMYMDIINRTGKPQNIKSSSSNNLLIQSTSNFPNDFNDDKSDDSNMQNESKALDKSSANIQSNNFQQKEKIDMEVEVEQYSKNNREIQGTQLEQNKETCFSEKQNKLNLDINIDGENVNSHQSYDQCNKSQKEVSQSETQIINGAENAKETVQEEQEELKYSNSNSTFFKQAQNKYFNKLSCLISDKEPSSQYKERSKDRSSKLGDDQETSQITYPEQNAIQQYKFNEECTQQINSVKEIPLDIKQAAFEEAVSEKIEEQLNNIEQYMNGNQRQNSSKFSNNYKENHKEQSVDEENKENENLLNIQDQIQMEIEQKEEDNRDDKGTKEQFNQQKNNFKNKFNYLEQQIDQLIEQNPIEELNSVRINFLNKQGYTFEDEVYIIQNRIFLLETVEYFNLVKDYSTQDKLNQLQNIELDKIINMLSIQYLQQQDVNLLSLEQLKTRIKKDCKDEKRINDYQDLDFNDILIDLNTMNPIEHDYIRFLESKQQLDYNQSIQLMQQQQIMAGGEISDLNTFGQKSLGSTKQVMIKHNEETRCQVCNECDYADNDLIVFCSRCNMSVHQKCYGIASLPQEDWICDGCTAFGPHSKHLRCALCTKRGGALKRSKMPIKTNFFEYLNTDYHNYLKSLPEVINDQSEVYDTSLWEKEKKKSLSKEATGIEENQEETELYFDFQFQNKVYPVDDILRNEPKSKNIWIHLTCALWIQECYFEERSSLNMIRGVENIDKKRFHLTCMICKQKKSGCCIQCAKGKCSASFHPECARRAGLSLEVRHLEKVTHLVFCQRHTPLKLRRILEQKEKKYKDEIQKFCRSIEKYNETYFNEFKIKDKQKIFKPSKTLLKKALKDQEKEEKEFMKQFSQHLLDTPQTNFVITLGKEYDDFEESIMAYHVLDISRPRQSHLKTQISKHDDIWKTMEFNEYSPIHLFKLYKKLVKSKRAEFKSIFNNLKRIKDKEQEEIISKQQKQMKKEQMLLKKEIIRQEKERRKIIQKQKQIEGISSRKILHTENDNLESSQINNTNDQYGNELSFLDDETSKQQFSQSEILMQKGLKPKRKYNKQKKNNSNTNIISKENGYSSNQLDHNTASVYENGESRSHLKSHFNAENTNNNIEKDYSNEMNDHLSASSDFPLKSKSKEKKLQKLLEKENQRKIKAQREMELSQQQLDEADKMKKKNFKRSKEQEEGQKRENQDKQKKNNRDDGDNENDEEKLYCYCQKPYNEGEFMIQCCNCEEWFHFECIGYIGTDSEAENFDFCCNECDVDGTLFQNREIYEHLFDPHQALYTTYKQLKNKITTPSFRQKLLLERKDMAISSGIISSNNLKSEKKKDKKNSSINLEAEVGKSNKSKQTQSQVNLESEIKNKSHPAQESENIEQQLLNQLLQISESQMKKQQEKLKKTNYKIEDDEEEKIKQKKSPIKNEKEEPEIESFSDIMGSSDEEDKRTDNMSEGESLDTIYREYTETYIKQNNITLDDVSTIITLRKLEDGTIIIVQDEDVHLE